METRQLEYFLQLAKYQHVSQTADFLNISQPSLSKSISQLESDLGVRLFDRKGKRISLNENGRQFARYVSESLQLLDEGIFTAKKSRYDTLGSVTIVCYSFSSIITPCVAEYNRLNPLIDFVLVEPAEANETRRMDTTDFILTSRRDMMMENREEQFWGSRALFQERYVLVMSDSFRSLPADQKEVDLAEFRNDPFIAMIQSIIFFRDYLYQLCQAAGFFPRILCQTDSFLVKMDLVREGQAVAILPESCLDEARRLVPDLRIFQIAHHDAVRTIYLMRRQQSVMTESALDFWDFAMDYYHCE